MRASQLVLLAEKKLVDAAGGIVSASERQRKRRRLVSISHSLTHSFVRVASKQVVVLRRRLRTSSRTDRLVARPLSRSLSGSAWLLGGSGSGSAAT